MAIPEGHPANQRYAGQPDLAQWKTLAADFEDYRVKVYGRVENPAELSLEELRAMANGSQITLHYCIQGWSGIAQWGGLPMIELMGIVRLKPNVKAVIFYSLGEGLEGSILRQPYD